MRQYVRIIVIVFNFLTFPIQNGIAKIDTEWNLPENEDFMQLAKKYDRHCEEHNVTTEDGYVMTLHRLVGNETKPIFLSHGILDSSDAFLVRGRNSTAFVLNEAGYDVWLGNSRGNKYSRRHTTLDPDKDVKKFWDFSFHEMGYYDLPASIDFILSTTGQKKLSAIGHSQANTAFYVLGSTRPEYNAKVHVLLSLAPVAHLNHLKQLAKLFPPVWPVASTILALFGIEELFQQDSFESHLLKFVCLQGEWSYDFCVKDVLMPAIGNDSTEFEPDFLKEELKHFPAGVSKKLVDHFAQLAIRKKFSPFDYGVIKNVLKYGAASPGEYDLNKVTMRVALLYGDNDNIATVEDVKQLRGELPNVVYSSAMDRKEFNHIDFTIGRNINVYLNPLLIKLLREYGIS